MRQDLNFNNKNISQVERVNGVNFSDKIREPETYKIFNDSGTIKVLDSSGQLNYSGTNLSILLNNINTTMPANSTIEFYGGEYNITGEVKFNKNVNLVCNGVCLISASLPGVSMFNFSGRTVVTVNLDADIINNAGSFYVDDASQAEKGDLVLVYDDVIWNPIDYPTWKTGELHRISDVDIINNKILIEDSFINNYSTTLTGTVNIIRPMTATISGEFILDAGGKSAHKQAVTLLNTMNSNVNGVTIRNAGYYGIDIINSFETNIVNSNIENTVETGLGYGVVSADASAFTNIHDNVFTNNRHGVSVGGSELYGQSRDLNIYNNIFMEANTKLSGQQAIDAHPIAESMNVYNNIIYATVNTSDYGISFGSKRTYIDGNKIFGGSGIQPRESVSNRTIIITNNQLFNASYIMNTGYNTDNSTYIKICNNYAEGNRVVGIQIINASYIDVCGNHIQDTGIGDGNQAITIKGVSGGFIRDNTVINPYSHGIALTNVNFTSVVNNILVNVNYRGANVHGIYLVNSSNNSISNNYIKQRTSNGYAINVLDLGGAISGNNSITENRLDLTNYARSINRTTYDTQRGNFGVGNNTYSDGYPLVVCDKSFVNQTGSFCWNQTSQATNVFNGTRWLWSGNGTEII